MKSILASHVAFIGGRETYGPSHQIFEQLLTRKDLFSSATFIKHDIFFKERTKILVDGQEEISTWWAIGKVNWIISIFFQTLINITYICKNRKNLYYIGVDPLNGFVGVIVKLLSRTNVFIYFTPDFSDNRFVNVIQNYVYKLLDTLSLRYCDFNWSVSRKIVQKRAMQGLHPNKNCYLPNTPKFDPKLPKLTNTMRLVTVSHLSSSFDITSLIQIMSNLSEITPMELVIVGDGPDRSTFEKLAHESNIKFVGQKQHEELMQYLSESFMGLALYTGSNSWDEYRDPLKAREYLAAGIPVIISDGLSISLEIKENNVGFVHHNPIDTSRFIKECIANREMYKLLVKNAINMAKETSKDKLLNKLINDSVVRVP